MTLGELNDVIKRLEQADSTSDPGRTPGTSLVSFITTNDHLIRMGLDIAQAPPDSLRDKFIRVWKFELGPLAGTKQKFYGYDPKGAIEAALKILNPESLKT